MAARQGVVSSHGGRFMSCADLAEDQTPGVGCADSLLDGTEDRFLPVLVVHCDAAAGGQRRRGRGRLLRPWRRTASRRSREPRPAARGCRCPHASPEVYRRQRRPVSRSRSVPRESRTPGAPVHCVQAARCSSTPSTPPTSSAPGTDRSAGSWKARAAQPRPTKPKRIGAELSGVLRPLRARGGLGLPPARTTWRCPEPSAPAPRAYGPGRR